MTLLAYNHSYNRQLHLRSNRPSFVKKCLVALLFAVGVAFTANAGAATTVKFGAPPWPGVMVKTSVARHLLEAIGYETDLTKSSWVINVHGIADGSIDVDLGIWMPTQKSTIQPMADAGKIRLLVKNVPNAKYDVVVPEYVWDAGVHCICDLDKYAEKFDHKIYGIEAGNDGNQTMNDAIKNDTYNLGDWNLRPSSTAAMLAEAGSKMEDKKWIVFLGWKPHWMNIKYDLRYLKDPKEIWGGGSSVLTAINPDFADAHPNLETFFKQLVVPTKIQSGWINKYGHKNQKLDSVAQDWIKNNHDVVAKWLKGVKTADGEKDAMDAVKAEFPSS
ncbi:ABC transporter substrate-binding protein [Salinisphaera sp. USBA-960]|nr:ABC transporter substrate-binding protein [Salifodinibacter halophilus]NNC27050.1 ABC transporter substrate-binding protein [Salifodinibacter halophilus]